MASGLVGLDKGMLFINYNDRFRKYRKLFFRLFGSKSSTTAFNSIEEEETRRFLHKVLQKPEDLVGYLRSYVHFRCECRFSLVITTCHRQHCWRRHS